MGLQVHTGDGGFYHWLELPRGLDADELNRRLFQHGAAILKGFDCDMARPHAKDPGYRSPYASFFRFSFGPLPPESFESDVAILKQVLDEYRADVG
jgi:DNA-binding transcriptional MocR family regulator